MTGNKLGGAVAVTGGAGFIGLNLVTRLARDGRQVVALHHSPLDPIARVVAREYAGSVLFARCDVRDTAALREAIKIHNVRDIIHAAAITSPVQVDPMAMLDVNLRATQALLDLAGERSLRRLIFVSSAGVFRSAETKQPLPEAYPVTMDHPYAIFKVAAERLVAHYRGLDGIDATSVRLGFVYGPYERPTTSRTAMSSVYQAVARARRRQPIVTMGPMVERDWTHAGDVARGVAVLLAHPGPVADLYHIGVGRNYTMRETLETIAALMPGTAIHWVDDPRRATIPVGLANRRAALGIDRARRDLGYEPHFSLREGIIDYVAYLDRTETETVPGRT